MRPLATREPGKITGVKVYTEDHGIPTVSVDMTRLENRREEIERDIAHHERRIRERREEAKRIDDEYVAWSNYEAKKRKSR